MLEIRNRMISFSKKKGQRKEETKVKDRMEIKRYDSYDCISSAVEIVGMCRLVGETFRKNN